jgi:hypothetical protein
MGCTVQNGNVKGEMINYPSNLAFFAMMFKYQTHVWGTFGDKGPTFALPEGS